MITNVEFYNTPDGRVMVNRPGKSVMELNADSYDLVSELLQMIKDSYPEAIDAIETLYSKSKLNRSFYEYKIVNRFIRCNFGKYDLMTLDIDEYGRFNLEEVDCPLRDTGDCPFCHVICKPKLKNYLTEREDEVCRLVSEGCSNEEIAHKLHISSFTVIRHRNNVRAKIGATNTAHMIKKLNKLL